LPSPDGWIFDAVLGGFGGMVIAYVLIRVFRPSLLDRVGTSVDDDTPFDAPGPLGQEPAEQALLPAAGT
jgi:hypothetical protein